MGEKREVEAQMEVGEKAERGEEEIESKIDQIVEESEGKEREWSVGEEIERIERKKTKDSRG
eukprot:207092-Amorphochlora_amoeboformis.AAC.1